MAGPSLNPRDHVTSIPGGSGNAGQPLVNKVEVSIEDLRRLSRQQSGQIATLTGYYGTHQRHIKRQQRRIEELTSSLRWTQFALVVLAVADIVWVVAS